MTKIRTYQRGETVPIWAEIQNWADAYINPTDDVTLELTDPNGDVVNISGGTPPPYTVAMSQYDSEDGIFVYYYATSSSSVKGWWRYKATAQDGTSPAKYTIAEGGFWLE